LASCLVFVFVATNSLAWSPTTPEIAVAKFGGTATENNYSVAVDSSGNIYTTGYFGATADFDPGTGTSNLEANSLDVFVSKLNSAGELVWAHKFGSFGFDIGYDVAVDSSGNVYTTGYFTNTVDFDPGAGTSNLTSAGAEDVFVLKLSSTGAFVWAKQFGGTGTDEGRSIAVDSSGNVHTTGLFQGTADFDPGAGTSNLTSAGSNDVFVSKLDSTGAFVWAKQFGSTGNDIGRSIAVDSSGNVHTTGSFELTVDFDPDPAGGAVANLTSAGETDVFVSKLNSTGAFVWAKRFGAASTDRGYSVAVDSSGNVYSTGIHMNFVDFDPGDGNVQLGGRNFVSKLNSTGAFVWAKTTDNAGSSDSIAVDSSGNVYTTGNFPDTVDFDPGAGTTNLTSAGSADVFVSKLDSTGAFVWAKGFGGTSSDIGQSVAIDTSGNVYISGEFQGTADFDPGTGTSNLTSSGSKDVFVSKLTSAGEAISMTTTTTTTTTTTPAQAEEARRLEESRNAFELSERCRKANHAFNDCPLWPGNATTTATSTSSTSSTTSSTSSTTTTPATSSTTTTPATSSTTTTPATSSTTSTTTTSPKVLTKQSLWLKVSFAPSSRRLSKPAQTNLQLLVNRLNQASNISITCSGTMTLGERQNSKSLARNRATSVCAKLRSLGVKATFNTTSNPISKLTKNQGRFVVVAVTYSSN
jgi:outer membrane protein OmpA-like peptidoglycan-associated protein